MTGQASPVVHVVAAGEVGGAERLLVRLAGAHDRPRPHIVALWTADPALRALFADAGITVMARHQSRHRALLPPLGGADVRWLAAQLRSTRAAAVHLHTFASHVLGSRAGRLAGVPVVRTEHSRRAYDHWLCRPLSAWSLRRSARVVAVSADLGALVRRRFPALADRLSVIPNGVPVPALAPRKTHGPLRLTLVARLEPRKAVDRALRALRAVPDAHLDIVGDGPLRAQLERLAATLGVAPRVRFWGYQRQPEAIVARGDAMLCSSRTEGLPLSLLEGMALGRPCIAVPVGGVPEIVRPGHTGWLAASASADHLAAAIHEARAAGRGEIARRGLAARRLVESDFSDARMRAAYEDLYRSLSRSAPAAGAQAA